MILNSIEEKIKQLSFLRFPYTNVVGLARSIIAVGTLLTLITNSESVIIQRNVEGEVFNPLLSPLADINHFNFFLILGFDNFDYMKIMAVIILMLVISGFYIKISSVLHWWVSISFFFGSSVIDGGDQIAAVLTFLLIPLCLTDDRKNHWHTKQPSYSSKNVFGLFSIYLIRFQIAIIYFHAAVGKFDVREWMNGTALYYWLNHSFFGSSDNLVPIINMALKNDWAVTILTYGVIVFELMLFLALTASRKYRKKILPIGIAFHFSIILFHGIFSFFFSIVGGLILYLLPTYQPLNLRLWYPSK